MTKLARVISLSNVCWDLSRTFDRGLTIKMSLLCWAYTRALLVQRKVKMKSKKISNDQELIQSDPTSCPQNQKNPRSSMRSIKILQSSHFHEFISFPILCLFINYTMMCLNIAPSKTKQHNLFCTQRALCRVCVVQITLWGWVQWYNLLNVFASITTISITKY